MPNGPVVPPPSRSAVHRAVPAVGRAGCAAGCGTPPLRRVLVPSGPRASYDTAGSDQLRLFDDSVAMVGKKEGKGEGIANQLSKLEWEYFPSRVKLAANPRFFLGRTSDSTRRHSGLDGLDPGEAS